MILGLVAPLCLSMAVAFQSCSNDVKSDNDGVDVGLVRNPNSANGFDDKMKMPVMSFDTETHDFGRLTSGESITYSFHFTNTGNADLIIGSCESTCGCTVADYPRQPIAPGQDGYIAISFKSAGKKGYQYQEVTVASNAQPARTKLKITAQVL